MAETYRAKQGDTWDFIAYRLFGDDAFMEELLQANQEYNHKFVLDGGETLTIPVIEEQEEVIWE